jgi:hypothetical protein
MTGVPPSRTMTILVFGVVGIHGGHAENSSQLHMTLNPTTPHRGPYGPFSPGICTALHTIRHVILLLGDSNDARTCLHGVRNSTCVGTTAPCLWCTLCYNTTAACIYHYVFGFLEPVWSIARSKHTYATEPLHPMQRLPLIEDALLRWHLPRVDQVVINVGLWDATTVATHSLHSTWQDVWIHHAQSFIAFVRDGWRPAAGAQVAWSTTPTVHDANYRSGGGPQVSLHSVATNLSALGVHAACLSNTTLFEWREMLCYTTHYELLDIHWNPPGPYLERFDTIVARGEQRDVAHQKDACATHTEWCDTPRRPGACHSAACTQSNSEELVLARGAIWVPPV